MYAKDIHRAINSLPNTSSVGNDNISTYMLKKSALQISKALEIVFNKSIYANTFPANWKSAVIIPVHKKGDIYNMANYRPISLFPVISKVFEKLIDEKLKLFMQDHNILNNAQHGFRQKKWTETALLQLTKSLFERKAAKFFIYIVALDASRAFDTLDLKIMCNFLSYFISESTVA